MAGSRELDRIRVAVEAYAELARIGFENEAEPAARRDLLAVIAKFGDGPSVAGLGGDDVPVIVSTSTATGVWLTRYVADAGETAAPSRAGQVRVSWLGRAPIMLTTVVPSSWDEPATGPVEALLEGPALPGGFVRLDLRRQRYPDATVDQVRTALDRG